MAFDIRKTVEDLVEKIRKDPDILKKFQKEPVKTIEKLIGVDLPDDQIEKVVELVRAKIDLDKVGDCVGGLGGLFGKK